VIPSHYTYKTNMPFNTELTRALGIRGELSCEGSAVQY
jgi:hypothetical protein